MESLQFAFNTLQDATNNFSDDNKIGAGGFGDVYKVELYRIWFINWLTIIKPHKHALLFYIFSL